MYLAQRVLSWFQKMWLNWDALFSSIIRLMLFMFYPPALCWLSGGQIKKISLQLLLFFFILNCYWTQMWFSWRRKGPSWLYCSDTQWSGSEYKWLVNPCQGIMLSLFNTPWEEDMRTGWNSELKSSVVMQPWQREDRGFTVSTRQRGRSHQRDSWLFSTYFLLLVTPSR